MAFAHVISGGAVSVDLGDTAVTGSLNTSGATLLVAHIADYAAVTQSTISDSNSNSWTGVTAEPVSGSGGRSKIYYCLSPTVGSGHTFTASSPGSNSYPSIQVSAFSGTGAFDQRSGANQGGAIALQPGSLTPPSNDALFVTGLGFDATRTMGIDSSFTIGVQNDFSAANAFGGALAYFIQTTAAAKNPMWSWTGACEGLTSMVTFTLSVGGGGSGKPAHYYAQMRRQ